MPFIEFETVTKHKKTFNVDDILTFEPSEKGTHITLDSNRETITVIHSYEEVKAALVKATGQEIYTAGGYDLSAHEEGLVVVQ